jgi:hypothetical protein
LVSDHRTESADQVPDVLTTNMGRIGIPEEVGDFCIERVFFTPSVPLLMEIPAGVAPVAGRLTLTLNYHDEYFEPERIGRIAEETLRARTHIK